MSGLVSSKDKPCTCGEKLHGAFSGGMFLVVQCQNCFRRWTVFIPEEEKRKFALVWGRMFIEQEIDRHLNRWWESTKKDDTDEGMPP